jgi:glucose/arabinose dehydrogenase
VVSNDSNPKNTKRTSSTFERAVFSVFLALLAGLAPVLLNAESAVATVPSGFTDRPVRLVDQPTALAFTPDGRMLVTTKIGQLRVYERGTPGTTRALDISGKTCSNSERGLLGVAVDPNFANNHYVYLYYTYKKHGVCPDHKPANPKNPVNRVSRFVMAGNTVDSTSEKVLINNIPSPNGNHNAGDLKFGKNGYLYVSVGDGACDYAEPTKCQYNNDASRDRHVLLGKILRITRSGGIPPGNPYTNPDNSARCKFTGRTEPGKNCQETFARGLRNPFRIAFDPDATGTRFRINDVGGAAWEEIDAGKKGADYAWNLCEGRHDNPSRPGSVDCANPPFTPPLHEYSHNTGCESITGGAFVPDSSNWPASYHDSYLFGDYVCNRIFRLTLKSGGGFARSSFAAGLGDGGPIAMAFGPDGSSEALYYTTFANGGEVRRIAYTG